ncbi:MAG: glycosyltransferase family 4 protein [Acidobacteria bacterium]|nr:glycosyltransferase family 4 protein [Acidobacteriota bacterium]
MVVERPPRVLFWSGPFPPSVGGVQAAALHLLEGLCEHRIELEVIARRDRPELPERDTVAGYPVHRSPYYNALASHDAGRIVQTLHDIEELIERIQPDFLHLFTVGPNLFFVQKIRALASLPTIVTLHGELPKPMIQAPLLRNVLSRAKTIATCSEAVRRATIKIFPDLGNKIRAIPNGIPSAMDPVQPPPQHPRLLFLGRLAPEKGLDLAVRTLARLTDRFPDVRLTVAGQGPERPGAEALARALGVFDRVEFLGWVPPHDVPALLDASTLLLMPSRMEGLGIAAIEAAHRARPVVASRTGGLPEVIKDGITGLTVPPGDVPGLALAVGRLLAGPDLAAALGAAARRHVRSAFPVTSYADAYAALYRRHAETD